MERFTEQEQTAGTVRHLDGEHTKVKVRINELESQIEQLQASGRRLKQDLRRANSWKWSAVSLLITVFFGLPTLVFQYPAIVQSTYLLVTEKRYEKAKIGIGSDNVIHPNQVIMRRFDNSPFAQTKDLQGCVLEIFVSTSDFDEFGRIQKVRHQFRIRDHREMDKTELDAFVSPVAAKLLGITNGFRKMPGRLIC